MPRHKRTNNRHKGGAKGPNGDESAQPTGQGPKNTNRGDKSSTKRAKGTKNKHNGNSRARDKGAKAKNSNKGWKGHKDQQKQKFEEHLDDSLLTEGLASGKFVKGILRVNPANATKAYVSVESLVFDVLLEAPEDRNRALPGDTVVLELHPKSKWIDETVVDPVTIFDQTPALAAEVERCNKLWQPIDTSSLQAASASNPTIEHHDHERRATGKVVGIMERKPHELVGFFVVPKNHPEGKPLPSHFSFVLFDSRNGTYPYMKILRKGLPKKFLENPRKYDKIVKAKFERWDVDSDFPWGQYVGIVGEMGDIAAETEALLQQHAVRHCDFPDEVLQCVKQYSDNWTPPAEEVAKREDLRHLRIVSIDPTTAKDLDDALSIEWDSQKQLYRIGVHIADVSYFVKPGTALDEEAQKRATTVYLVQHAYPMLPRILCEKLCSLNPKVDRLAFSCFWYMSRDGALSNKHKVWFGKSIIHTACQLDYRTAQDMIDGRIYIEKSTGECVGLDTWEEHRRPTGRHTKAQVIEDVKALNAIARKRRALRVDAGSFMMSIPKMSFKLDPDTRQPTSAGTYVLRASNNLVEEYMLLANNLVARELITYNWQAAFLIRHAPPDAAKLVKFQRWCTEMGLCNEGQSLAFGSDRDGGTLQQSVRQLRAGLSEGVGALLELNLMGSFTAANYFPAGSDSNWRHYALAMPYYTHFTSPIRRYADLVVHRQLQEIIEWKQRRNLDEDEEVLSTPPEKLLALRRIAEHCNQRKQAADDASLDSDKLFLWAYLRQKDKEGVSVIVSGVVADDGETFATMYVAAYGLKLKLYYDQMERILKAKIDCIYEDESDTDEESRPHDKSVNSEESRRAQFADRRTSSKPERHNDGHGQKDQKDQKDRKIERHIVTWPTGQRAEIKLGVYLRLKLTTKPRQEYFIMLQPQEANAAGDAAAP